MDRLNYFNPYSSKDGGHEDQLTRAYLVLLKYSHQAFSAFYSYCLEQYVNLGSVDEVGVLPYYHHLLSSDIDISTQRSSYSFKTSKLLSVVISDKELEYEQHKVTSAERTARYDGIIQIGDELSIIIENKPKSEDVWINQLNPSKSNLPESEIEILEKHVSLEWKEIIRQLNSVISNPELISREEKILIDDFLSYIDDQFVVLNPYDNFNLCKDNPTLINRRVKNLLENVAGDAFEVRKQRGWGFEIELDFPEVRMAGLLLDEKEDDWQLTLALYFGLGVGQGRNLYRHEINLEEVRKAGFDIHTHFKFGFISDGIIEAFPRTDVERFVEYWSANPDDIRQLKREEVEEYLKKLSKANVLDITESKKKEIRENFWETKRQTLNPNPALGLHYKVSSEKAKELDSKGEFGMLIKEKLCKALSIIDNVPDQFKNQ